MAVMLRSLGIPARLATGFQSGVYNPVSDLWLMRASDAHSWVEAWIPGYGWKTFDPTPADPNAGGLGAVDPSGTVPRRLRNLLAGVGRDLRPGSRRAPSRTAWNRARSAWVSGWFDTAASLACRVEALWSRLGRAASAGSLSSGWWLCVALGFAAGPLLRLLHIRRRVERVRRGQASVADATVLYQRMLHILKRRGYQKPLWFTPAEFAASLPRTPLGQSVGEFTATYNALRFGGHAEAASTLSILLDRMERHKLAGRGPRPEARCRQQGSCRRPSRPDRAIAGQARPSRSPGFRGVPRSRLAVRSNWRLALAVTICSSVTAHALIKLMLFPSPADIVAESLMIRLTRLNRAPMVLNSDLIEHIDVTPDTVITMTTGQILRVRESADEVVERIVEFRRRVFDQYAPPVRQRRTGSRLIPWRPPSQRNRHRRGAAATPRSSLPSRPDHGPTWQPFPVLRWRWPESLAG